MKGGGARWNVISPPRYGRSAPVTGHLASLGEEISGGGIDPDHVEENSFGLCEGGRSRDLGRGFGGARREARTSRGSYLDDVRKARLERIAHLPARIRMVRSGARVSSFVFLARKRAAGAGGDSSRKSGDAGGARTASVASTRRRRVRGSEDTRRCRASRRGRVLCGRVGRGRQRGFARRGNARLAFVRTWRRTPCACSGCVARRVRLAP